MKHRTQKIALPSVIGRPVQHGENVRLTAKHLQLIDLRSAADVASIIVEGFPYVGLITTFEKSGSHWKISVSCPLPKAAGEEREIWDAALRMASTQLKVQVVKNPAGLWIQRLWLPLNRDGDVALRFVEAAIQPVINEASKLLVGLANAPYE